MANEKGKGLMVGVIVTSVLLVGTAAFFIIRAIRTRKDLKKLDKKTTDETPLTPVGETAPETQYTPPSNTPPSGTTTGTTTTTSTGSIPTFTKFPIMQGQRGEDVRNLQKLLLQFDRNILPKYGADGQFGSETASALNKVLGKTVVINQDDINTIVNNSKRKALTNVGMAIGMGRFF